MKFKEMKRIIILCFAFLLGNMLYAQQLPQITQYTFNNYAINPAVSGMYDYYQVNTTIRNQWIGINDAPRTNVISVYGKRNEQVSLGGTVYNDITGPTSKSGGAVSYTYTINVLSDIRVSLALQGGFTQFKIIKDKQKVADQDDPFFQGGDVVRLLPDATFGLNVVGKKWYLGIAIPQLLSSELRLMDDDQARWYDQTSQNGKLSSQVYLLGAWNYDISSILNLEASTFLKSASGAKTQTDLGLKIKYKELCWLGLNSQLNNNMSSLATLFGINLNEKYTLGYSYGMPNSDVSTYNSGSHEFMLAIKILD